ncbi:MAG: UDP-N-acetylmuramoyl-L-alanyl-D-glutamate--2,6-diaminopimelate ligase [Acidobacteriota bacterium]
MPTGISLATLLSGCEARYWGPSDEPVTGLAYDSRQVIQGQAFVAIPGFVHDGTSFASEAIDGGAVAVVAEVGPEAVPLLQPPRTWARVGDARLALARMACCFYENPSHQLTVVGVTGTDGKTTVTALLEAMLAERGPCGRWSTTAVRIGGRHRAAERTTPEAPDLQRALWEMVGVGCWAAAIEVSSHALVLQRVAGTRFGAAIFTNLSPDHLDFHQGLEDYLNAKAGLFESLREESIAVLNAGDPVASALAKRTPARVVGYGWDAVTTVPTAYSIRQWSTTKTGSKLLLETPQGALTLRSPLFGRANAENLAAATAAAMELGCSPAQVVRAAASFAGVRGRLQTLQAGQPFTVLVDYAHTPGALRAALAASRDLTPHGRLIVVFGCGGDRDPSKRPVMGRVAAGAAEQVLITTDNPRSEDPEAIIGEIAAGIPPSTAATVERQPDRRRAIERALSLADPGDCVLIAGKGHETEQLFADRAIAFDDLQVAQKWLASRFGEDSQGGGVDR